MATPPRNPSKAGSMMPSSISSSSRQSFKNETDYKNNLISLLISRSAHVQRHEDKNENYIPDMSLAINGGEWWIEVKYCKKSPTSLTAIPHYTTGQRDWLIQRGKNGAGKAYLLVGLPDCDLLIHHSQLIRLHDLPLSTVKKFGRMFEDLTAVARYIVERRGR